jgi:hypothetical protein
VGLRPLACRGCGFEFRLGMDVCLMIFEFGQVEFSASDRSPVYSSPNACGASESDRRTSIVRRPWPIKGCRDMDKRTENEAIKQRVDQLVPRTLRQTVLNLLLSTCLRNHKNDANERNVCASTSWTMMRKVLKPHLCQDKSQLN